MATTIARPTLPSVASPSCTNRVPCSWDEAKRLRGALEELNVAVRAPEAGLLRKALENLIQ
eukprot:12246388-Ditylum_brightwellii.AAC.1